MTTLSEFIASAEQHGVRLHADSDGLKTLSGRRDDAFFQGPLLSLCLVIIAKERAGTLKTSEIPVWVGAVLTKHFDDSMAVRMQLEWSLEYRQRCADAAVFLENLGLITVKGDSTRQITCIERGVGFLRAALKLQDEVGILTRALTKAYRIVHHHGLTLL